MKLTAKKNAVAQAAGRGLRKIRTGTGRGRQAFKRLPKKKKTLIFVSLLLVLSLGGVTTFTFAGKAVNAQTIRTAKAQKGTISNTVVGTGNLEMGSGTEIDIPAGITVEEVLVESGEKVAKGDALAKVDGTSVLKTLSQVRELITYLDSQINAKKGDTEASSITAGVSGRVKKIYAKKGASVQSYMADKGALMLLSADGKMAVSINDADGLSAGDTVSVILSDHKTKKTGSVESVSGSTAMITLTDDGPKQGETVTVKKDGSSIGTGKLYIHSQVAVVGTGGTVKELRVSENQSVSATTVLYTLKNLPASVEYRELLAQRQDLSETLSSLAVMAQTNTITASESGTIEAVNLSTGASGSSGSGSADSEEDSNAQGTTGAVSATSAESPAAIAAIRTVAASEDTQSGEEQTAVWEDDSQSSESAGKTSAQESSVKQIASVNIPLTAPVKGSVPQSAIEPTSQYTGAISWNLKTETFQADSTYTAKIALTAASGYEFTQATSVSTQAAGSVISGVSVDGAGEGNAMTFTVTFTKTEKAADTTQNATSASQSKNESKTEKKASSNVSKGSGTVSGGSGNNSSVAAASGVSGSSASGSGSNSTGDSSSSEEIEMVAAFRFASDKEMILPISVDELDILSIEKGQEAAVTFDAIEDQSYTGTITKVASAAEASGGVAKYSVSIAIPADDSMRVGMNGSATVTISSKKDIILIPLNALQESGEKNFVYTEKDGDGNLSGKKEVEVGISNGENVEITKGLSEGDTVYYTRTGSLSQSGSSDAMPGGFGGGGDQQPPSGAPGDGKSGGNAQKRGSASGEK